MTRTGNLKSLFLWSLKEYKVERLCLKNGDSFIKAKYDLTSIENSTVKEI